MSVFAKMIYLILNEGAITMNDLEEFSGELKERMVFFTKRC